MTEERITRVENPDGNTHTSTTIISDGEPRRSGAGTWFVLFVVLLAVLVGIWAFTQMGGAEMNKDNAVAEAADQVGAAAENIGDAAKDAGQAAENAADRVTGQ